MFSVLSVLCGSFNDVIIAWSAVVEKWGRFLNGVYCLFSFFFFLFSYSLFVNSLFFIYLFICFGRLVLSRKVILELIITKRYNLEIRWRNIYYLSFFLSLIYCGIRYMTITIILHMFKEDRSRVETPLKIYGILSAFHMQMSFSFFLSLYSFLGIT